MSDNQTTPQIHHSPSSGWTVTATIGACGFRHHAATLADAERVREAVERVVQKERDDE